MLVRPRVPNDVTVYTYRRVSKILDGLSPEIINVNDFGKNLAIRKEIEICLEDVIREFAIVLFYGHGSKSGDSLIGQDQRALIDLQNNYMLQNKICYIVACCSAKVLGPDSISKNAVSYIGFRKKYVFIHDLEESFGECANAGILKMIREGCTTGQAKQAIQEQLILWENRWMDKGDIITASIYHQNVSDGEKENLTILGNQKVRL